MNISNIRMHKNGNLKYFESFSFKINFGVLLDYHLTLNIYLFILFFIVNCYMFFIV